MQRLFSNFANGWPGIGLLIQRLLIGTGLLHHGIIQVAQTHYASVLVFSFLEATAGVLLVLGLWTPVIGALAALVEFWGVCCQSGELRTFFILAVIAATLAMIGPGAWSMDARIFGRKHMDIPEH